MVDSMDIYNYLNINIATVMKNPEMLKFVFNHLKTKRCYLKMRKHAVKKLPYLLRYVLDQYKTQQICDKAILENGGRLKSVPDCDKNQEMCNKAVIITLMHLNLFLIAIRVKKCVIKLPILILLQ